MELTAAPKGDNEEQRTVLSIKIKNKAALYGAYMPFIKDKGMFVPTRQKYRLGDLVHLRIELLQVQEEFEVNGKVIWITPPAAQGNRSTGIGVQFAVDDESKALVKRVELELTGMLQMDHPTHTM